MFKKGGAKPPKEGEGQPESKKAQTTAGESPRIDPKQWKVSDVCMWVTSFKPYFGTKTQDIVKAFERNDIDGEILLTYVNPEELKKELGIESAGHCRRLIIAIDKLRGGEGQVATPYFHPSISAAPAVKSASKNDRFILESEFAEAPMEIPTGADLFISYAHADRELALKLKEDLEKQGLSCWMDTHLKTGDDWEMLLEENLTFSKGVVALITPSYEVSESCRNEIRLSLNRGKRIFPVLAATLKQTPKVPLPDDHWPPHGFGFALARTQYNDFRKNWMLPTLMKDLEAYGVRKYASNQLAAKWLPVTQGGEVPGVRFGAAFFNFGSQTVLYGGCTYEMFPERQEIIEHSDTYFLNNETMVWSKVAPTGKAHPSGYGCSALLCGEGEMLCIGGGNYAKSFNDVTLLSFASMAWRTPRVEGTPPPTRYGHTATLVNKKIYVFGGRQGNDYFDDIYVLDISGLPDLVKWSKLETKGTGPSPRYQSTATLVGGYLLIYGGSKIDVEGEIDQNIYLLDLHRNQWTVASSQGKAPQGRRQHSAVLVGHRVLFYGGKGKQASLGDLAIYDTQSYEWQSSNFEIEGRPPPARGLLAAVQRGNQLLMFGGLTDTVVRTFEVPDKGTQSQLLHLNDLSILEISTS